MDEQNTGSGADVGTAENQSLNQAEPNQTEQKAVTVDELNKMLAAEGDKRAKQALDMFKQKELPEILQQARAEAERLAAMSAEQKAEMEKKQAEEALLKRESEIARREMRIEAHRLLTEKGLPVELLDAINYSGDEECKKSIESIETAFRAAVEDGINKRLKSSPTPKVSVPQVNAPKSISEFMAEANANPGSMPEILKQIEKMRK